MSREKGFSKKVGSTKNPAEQIPVDPSVDPSVDLSVDLAGVKLPNPIMPASGTFEYDETYGRLKSPELFGAMVNKTIFPEARPGNPPPRVVETPCGMLNAIGIPSKGVDFFIKKTLPKLSALKVPLIISVAGNTTAEFCEIASRIEGTGLVDMVELNLSCPNLSHGIEWAQDRRLLEEVVGEVRKKVSLPIAVKLSPAVPDIGEMGRAAEMAGADVVSLINSFRGMVIDIEKRRPFLGNLTGGLSGPAIHPLAVYAVYAVYEKVNIPIIGMGGVSGWESALEMILAGATGVGVGMYNFIDPRAMVKIIEGLENYLEREEIPSLRKLIGAAHSE